MPSPTLATTQLARPHGPPPRLQAVGSLGCLGSRLQPHQVDEPARPDGELAGPAAVEDTAPGVVARDGEAGGGPARQGLQARPGPAKAGALRGEVGHLQGRAGGCRPADRGRPAPDAPSR
jgi:hypothetical protein